MRNAHALRIFDQDNHATETLVWPDVLRLPVVGEYLQLDEDRTCEVTAMFFRPGEPFRITVQVTFR